VGRVGPSEVVESASSDPPSLAKGGATPSGDPVPPGRIGMGMPPFSPSVGSAIDARYKSVGVPPAEER
jgi:hypothetical protein